MTNLTTKQALLIASDPIVISSFTERLHECGPKVIAIFDASELPATALSLGADLIVIAVERGLEMNAYHIGHAATDRSMATLFIAHNTTLLALESLASAVPKAIVVGALLSRDELIPRIIEALQAHCPTRLA